MPAGSCRAVTGKIAAATPFRVDSSVDWEPRVSPAGRAQPGATGLPTLRVEERPAACMQWLPVCLLREGRARNTTASRSSACCQFGRTHPDSPLNASAFAALRRDKPRS